MNRFFRNIRLYRIQSAWPQDEVGLSQALDGAAFKPCGTFNERSSGFEAPVEGAGDALCRSLMGADLLQLRVQSRVIPVAAVQEALTERMEAYRSRTRTEPSRRERRELKEEIYGQLLPQALLKSDRVQAAYLRQQGVLAIGTASETAAENFLQNLARAMVGLKYIPLSFDKAPTELLNKVFLGGQSGSLTLGREARMRDPSDPGTSVNWLDVDLADEAVRRHIVEGMRLDRLGMVLDGMLTFVLDENLVFRKLRLADQEEAVVEEEDPLAQHDAYFVVMMGAIQALLSALEEALGNPVS